MANVVVFGIRDFASLAHFYLARHTGNKVVAFTVDRAYVPEGAVFEGLPIVPFETVEETYPPIHYGFFAPMSPHRMNTDREAVYKAIRCKGYRFISYVSPRATVFSEDIGDNCFILEDNTIQPFVTIGDNVVMWSGNHIGHHGWIGDHVFFTSHVVLSGHCYVGAHSFFGVNSTIRDGLNIGEGTFVAMGACVVHDTEPWHRYMGVPAKKCGDSHEMG